LKISAHQDIELLVGAAKLYVRFERYGVVGHHERVEDFVQRERAILFEPLLKIVALQDLSHGDVRGELDEAGGAERVHPARVKIDDRLFRVEQLEDLRFVGLGVGFYLFARELRARGALARRVADQPCEISYQKDDGVAQLLKGAQLTNYDRVAKVYVGCGRVSAELDAQRNIRARRLFQLGAQLLFTNQLDRAFA
jgi:hypothetical protein